MTDVEFIGKLAYSTATGVVYRPPLGSGYNLAKKIEVVPFESIDGGGLDEDFGVERVVNDDEATAELDRGLVALEGGVLVPSGTDCISGHPVGHHA